MMNFVIRLRFLAAYLKMVRCGFFTPCLDIWDENGRMVPPEDPDYRKHVHAYIQVGLYDYYARTTKQWKIWRKMKRYRAALDRAEQLLKSQESDF